MSANNISDATRIQRLELFLNRELRGSTLANYAIKADIRAHRKAEKMNKSDVINNKLFEKQINNERHVTRLNIENVQMRYARKLHQLKLDQMRFEAESRAATAKTSDGESGRMPRHTWISSSNKIGNAQLRNIIRSSTSHSGKQKEEVEEVTPSRAKTAGSSKKKIQTTTEFLKSVKAQDIFMAKMSKLLKPVEQPVEEPVQNGEEAVEKEQRPKQRMTVRTNNYIFKNSGAVAKGGQNYPDAPEQLAILREHKLASSDKDDTMYTWLGFESQEHFDRVRGADRFKLAAKKVTVKEVPPGSS